MRTYNHLFMIVELDDGILFNEKNSRVDITLNNTKLGNNYKHNRY